MARVARAQNQRPSNGRTSKHGSMSFIVLFVVIAFALINYGLWPPTSDFDVELKLREAERALSQYTTDQQQCPVAILNTEKHTLEKNPNCPGSTSLMAMKPLYTRKQITFFLIYFNDHHHLAHQLDSWSKFSKAALDQIQFLIVDDGSAPGNTAMEFLETNRAMTRSLDIVVYKIDQNLVWNIGGARNLGFWMANTPWVFMSDGDIRVQPETMDYVLSLKDEPSENSLNNVYVLFQRLRDDNVTFKPHPAVMLLRRSDYWIAGGCDEDFVGHYGQTDPHFRHRVDQHPSLNSVKAHPLMDKGKVSPLLEMKDDIGCPDGATCLPSFKGEKPSRDTEPNLVLLDKKIKTGNWSNELLRFTWKRDEWKWGSWFGLFG